MTPKARPRVTAHGTFLPKRYRQWRLRAEGEIIMQLQKMNPSPELPIQQAEVRILLRGNHRGDGDNLAGSVLDSLVGAGVVPSDSLKHLPRGSWRYIAGGETGVRVEIRPI
ncbi:MAG: RusA family crossover junction endodeoxyribonuclease [Oscillatoria sp. SIO1A7]|nr:RusA family crossover junction endodeoxyribonuclease [Oscillatoria sp. SIO1A7]